MPVGAPTKSDVYAPVGLWGRKVPGWVCARGAPTRGGRGQNFQLLKSLNTQFAYQIHFTMAKQHFTMHLKIGDF